jgi:hypothetical protein
LLRREDGAIRLLVSWDANPPRLFHAEFDGADSRCLLCTVDEELFMRLSELAHKRFGNCVVYQMELLGIIAAFVKGEELPRLPATLGTTRFCPLKPGAQRR